MLSKDSFSVNLTPAPSVFSPSFSVTPPWVSVPRSSSMVFIFVLNVSNPVWAADIME